MSALVLPNTINLNKELISQKFSSIDTYKELSIGSSTLHDLIAHIKRLSLSPDIIIGSTKTPVVDWLATQHLFPMADVYLQQIINKKLQLTKIDSYELINWLDLTSKNATYTSKASKKHSPSKSNSITDMSDDDILYQIFLKTSWGEEDNKSILARYNSEMTDRALANPHLLTRIKKSEHDGTVAFQGVQQLKNKMRGTYHLKELEDWIETKYKNEDYKVKKSLKIQLGKENDFLKNKRVRNNNKPSKGSPYLCTLPNISIKEGIHPNSIINLPKDSTYNVYIDETGENFSTELNKEKSTGKYIAVVIPSATHLPELKSFHATDETPERIDQAVSQLLSKQIGIIGFSSTDNKIQKSVGWLNGIVQLVRWIAYLLPDSEKSNQKLNVVIEQRGDFTQKIDLRILEDLIFDELRTLDNKFEYLSLKLQFAGKDHPYLTYADAVALTWGGKAKTNRARLEKSKLEGYCLLSASDDTIEKLYLMANSEFKLSVQDWYKLCSDLPIHGKSWLHRYFDKIKEVVKNERETWLGYLNYIRELLALKNYATNDISKALLFLDQSRPIDCELSSELQLRLISTKLSATSHLGIMDDKLYKEAVDLINIIKKEDAQLASEGLLRLFSMTTNTFESEKISSIVKLWLEQPPLITGKLNFAKLHSTMGQIYAFNQNNEDAATSFNKAIQFFDELSNKSQAKIEKNQTYCYLLMVYISDDQRQKDAAELVNQLLGLFDNNIENMASSTFSPYVHHCVLKAITLRPQWFIELNEQYFNNSIQWKSNTEHPWQWIKLYRGLLTISREEDNGLSLCHEAYQDCVGKGVIFLWMKLVMQQLILQFDDFMIEPDQADIEYIHNRLPNAPLSILSHQSGKDINEIRKWLDNVLPFNFH